MGLNFPLAIWMCFMLLTFSCSSVLSAEEGFISIDITNKGLDFAKDLLIEQAVASLVPLQLPQIENSMKIPVVGNVHVVLSSITIYQLGVPFSTAKTGDTGLVIVASGATANLIMDWQYSYRTWLLPVVVSDSGVASVKVKGMEVGLTLGLKNQQGSLSLFVIDSGCYVKNIQIELDGGASWLYQGLVDAFESKIVSAVENAISEKIRDGAAKLNTLLQSLPREVSVRHAAALNITFVNDPVLSESSVGLEIDGLFMAKDSVGLLNDDINLRATVSCPDNMVGISLQEAVLNSASSVYFNAGLMRWTIDKLPDQHLLNTTRWRYVIPQLYKQYPNDDMAVQISMASPPIISIENQNIDAIVTSDVTIDVRDANEIVPVACISVEIRASASVAIFENSLASNVKLNSFKMSLEWSTIGNLHLQLVQSIISTILRAIVVPYVNLRLEKGFPLPIFRGYTLRNAQIQCANSRMTVCSDIGIQKEPEYQTAATW